MNRLTSSRTAPTATSPVPASKRSRKGSLRLDRGRSAVKQTVGRTGEVDCRIAASGGQGEEPEQARDGPFVAGERHVARALRRVQGPAVPEDGGERPGVGLDGGIGRSGAAAG